MISDLLIFLLKPFRFADILPAVFIVKDVQPLMDKVTLGNLNRFCVDNAGFNSTFLVNSFVVKYGHFYRI